jgi:hypothetical protein
MEDGPIGAKAGRNSCRQLKSVSRADDTLREKICRVYKSAGKFGIARRSPMIRVVQVLLSTALLFVVSQAHAADSTSQSTMSKRQMIAQMVDCMKKRMSADKTRTYNDAVKACKDAVNKESGDPPPGALVASETQPKH